MTSRASTLVRWGGLAGALAAIAAQASTQLDIPPRHQWDNYNGYCGECSIQQIGLYYGMYVSQYRIREIIDPTHSRVKRW